MSAGRGIWHSEFNASHEEEAKLLQIWVMPKNLNVNPRYDQSHFDFSQTTLKVFVCPDENLASKKFKDESKDTNQLHESYDFSSALTINQNAYFSMAIIESDFSYHPFDQENGVFMMVLKGKVEIEGYQLTEKDALGITPEDMSPMKKSDISFKPLEPSKILIMEIPMST